MMNTEEKNFLLNKHFESINSIILSRQDPITGLLPASTAINAHGDYTDAWVRDNVYSILSVWGLSLAYKKHSPKNYRCFVLRQSVVKLMRGLLLSMMRQSDRVERYKQTHKPTDALHAKYSTTTGLAVVGDDEWGHLQLDATSLYLLMLTQMTASGLSIIYTVDEVNFVQNLVHYISRTYSTPDYGIWERGNKINHGTTEINCSSVGMAKAALEAIKGFNLFGDIEAQEGVVHVALNDIARSRLTLQSLLPRESNSKETDAALLSIIGYPAYAVENESLVNKTRSKIIDKLAGRYGCKRFLLDGHQSSIEDFTRLHYEASELRDFQDIESEWPLFFTYLLLDSLMRKDEEGVKMWKEKLEPLFVQKNGQKLLPELYIVPKENITAEKENPSSQERIPNENIPLVWAQSLYMLSEMILDGVLKVNDIDPIKRRKYIGKSCSTVPMVPVLAQNSKIKEELLKYSIKAQTIEELDSVFLMHASELAVIHSMLGKNEKLGLSGKKLLVARTITTSRLHLIKGKKVIFLPYYFDPKSFYFGFDNKLLVEHFKDSLSFLSKNWNQSGRPIVPFLVREDMLVEKSKDEVLALLQMIQTGRSDSVEVEYGKLEELLPFANLERIDNLPEYTITKTPLGREIEQNASCENTEGLDALQMYQNAINEHDWVKVREVADQCKKYDDRLEDALMDIVISQKRLAVGRAYSEKAILSKPCTTLEILDVIYEYCGNNRAERVLTQEIILHLGTLIYVEPELFSNMITLRTWDFIQLLVGHISRSKNISIGDAYEELLKYPPHYIYDNLRLILKSYSKEVSALKHLENIEISGVNDVSDLHIQSIKQEHVNVHDWYEWREKVARLGVLPDHLYSDVWYILQQCHGLVIGDKYSLQNRLGSEETLESTAGERGFELKVDTLLQGIEVPVYRQLNIELIESLVKFLRLNPDLYIESDLILDVLIGHAVRITWNKRHEEKNYKEQKGKAWSSFYYLSIYEVQESFIDAFIFLTKNSEEEEHVN